MCDVPWLMVTEQPEWSEPKHGSGRKKVVDIDTIIEMHESGLSMSAIARKLGCDKSYIYRVIQEAT